MYCLITLKHEKCVECSGAVQQTVLPLFVSILQLCMLEPVCLFYISLFYQRCLAYISLCFPWAYLFNSSMCCARRYMA
jgi:hypothetical protein